MNQAPAVASTIIRNFSAGPGALPKKVLHEAHQAVLELPGVGLSILELNHRSPAFRSLLDEAEQRLRRLLEIPNDYRVLFLQGGATLQFSMVPMAMLARGATAEYVVGGYWSRKATEAARHHGSVRVVWDGQAHGFRRLPSPGELITSSNAAYVHYVSNETVEGLQFKSPPSTRAALVSDMSSDLLSRPCEVRPHSVIYAHAQKNLGTAGVTLVIAHDDVLHRMPPGLPPILDYRAHAEAHSILHTPPVFAIYVLLLTLRWLEDDIGGMAAMARINAEKARVVREALDDCRHFYHRDTQPDFESDVNMAFRCPRLELDRAFLTRAADAGLVGLEGHRSRGGLRISLFNGVSLEDARTVAAFVRDFATSIA